MIAKGGFKGLLSQMTGTVSMNRDPAILALLVVETLANGVGLGAYFELASGFSMDMLVGFRNVAIIAQTTGFRSTIFPCDGSGLARGSEQVSHVH